MQQREVYRFDFGESAGSEADKIRPGVIVQAWNPGLNTHLIVPCTSQLERRKQATGVFLPKEETGLELDSVAVCHLLTAQDGTRIIGGSTGRISEKNLYRIQYTLAQLLGIDAETFLLGDQA